ncbi:uncharacterized protein LOC143469788 isoform X2 [Clavelina lepadiformis]|uniref:uncharacterized protein LOC143469788 isoform X2 n=1 Tax=Clavelina lepadiformis TaxID=159417 RepID=UPI0040412752
MYLTSFGILSLLIGVLVRGIVGSCKTSENDTACPFGCCCNAEQYYVACNGKKFTKIPVGIPKDIKMLRFSNNILTNITSMVFESFQALETLNLNDNNIVSISTNAFANLKSLKTLDLSGNILIQFPWKSLLNLPKLQSLYLERNKLYDLPNEENILNRLGGLMHLSVYANPFLCSCKLLNFSSWLQHNLRATKSAGSVNVVKHETLKCTSRYGLVSYLLPYVNATGVYKSKCVKPDAKIFAGNISDDYLIKFGQTAITRSLEIYPSMATIYLHHNSSALVTCKSGSDDGDLMTAYFYNKTDGGSSFICVAENFAGTSFLEARLIEEKPKYFTQLLDGLDAITSEVQATLQPTRSDGTFYSNRNATSRQNELGVKKIRSQCAIGFNASVTILSPALELPLTYRLSLDGGRAITYNAVSSFMYCTTLTGERRSMISKENMTVKSCYNSVRRQFKANQAFHGILEPADAMIFGSIVNCASWLVFSHLEAQASMQNIVTGSTMRIRQHGKQENAVRESLKFRTFVGPLLPDHSKGAATIH